MRTFRVANMLCVLAAVMLACAIGPARADDKPARGFVRLFDGKTLDGWKLFGGVGPGYVAKDGVLVCPSDGGGNLFTEKEYSDFHLKFEFKLSPGGNNGIGIRAPLQGDAAYVGMEVQVLDDPAPEYAKLEPGQYHGSIYKVLPAKRGALKPAGQWNREEIRVIGRKIKVIVNGQVTVDGDLNAVTDPHTLADHPGILRQTGHHGASSAMKNWRDVSLIKVAVPAMLQRIADRAMQVFGAMGGSDDTPIHQALAWGRLLRIGDGPDEVHLRQIFRMEPMPTWSIANSPYLSAHPS